MSIETFVNCINKDDLLGLAISLRNINLEKMYDILQRKTPLIYAIHCASVEAISILLDHGADPEQHMADHMSPLMYSIYTKRIEVIKILLHNVSLPQLANVYYTGSIQSANTNIRDAILGLLFEAGMETDGVSPRGWTALHYACYWGHLTTVEKLLSVGSSINALDPEGCTPIARAIMLGRHSCVQALLDAGADVTISTKEGNTLLHMLMTQHFDATLVQGIINKGCDVNSQNLQGQTPLHLASTRLSHVDVSVLVMNGAKTDITDNKGSRAFDMYAGAVYT